MKVAVISVEQMLGKTTLIEILGGVYSRSQGKDVVVFSTGDVQDNIEIVTNFSKNEKLDNPYVMRALIENTAEDASAMLTQYGVQAGDEHVFMFDILNTVIPDDEKIEFLLEAIDIIPANLTLIEICGDIRSSINKQVLEKCDCALILTDTSLKGVKLFESVRAKLPRALQFNSVMVLSRLNPQVAGDKKIAEKFKIKTNNIYRFPYNPVIGRYAFDGELDKIVYNIIVGDSEVVNLRMPMQELMEFIYNTPKRKIVREISRWYK